MNSSLRVINNRYIIGGGGARKGWEDGDWKGTPLGMREGRSSSPSRGKRVEKEAAGAADGRREGVEGVPIYTSILNLLR